MTTVAVTADWALHDSVQAVTAFLRRIAPIFATDVTGWTLDLSRCTYLGPDAAALLVACAIDARRHGIKATVQLPRGNPPLDSFIKYSGLDHYLTGAPPPVADPHIVIPARVQTTSNFSDPDAIKIRLAGPFKDMVTVSANAFRDPQDRIVASAARLAEEVVRLLAAHDVIEIDLGGMRGVTSSYYNVLLHRVLEVIPAGDFPRRVKLRFDSAAQQLVFNRSLESATRGAA